MPRIACSVLPTLAALLSCLFLLGTAAPGARAAETAPAPACKRGEELEGLKRPSAAEQAYLKDLESKDGVACAPAKLEGLDRLETRCGGAAALATAGQAAKAKEAYAKILEAEPTACASAALKEAKKKDQSCWAWAATAAKDVVGVLGFVALALGALCLLILGALQILTRWHRTKDHRPASWILQPSLALGSMDDSSLDKKVGAGVASLVRSRIAAPDGTGLDIVNGQRAFGDVLKPLADVSSEAKAAVAVISFLAATLPRRNFEVAGALQQKGESGRGISIELSNENKQLGATTLWEHDFDAPDHDIASFQRLAIPTAAWLDHRIATALRATDGLLSADPQSWAMFKTAEAWHLEGNEEKAKALYNSALGIDAANVGALANLGGIEAQQKNYGKALTLLGRALDALEGPQ